MDEYEAHMDELAPISKTVMLRIAFDVSVALQCVWWISL